MLENLPLLKIGYSTLKDAYAYTSKYVRAPKRTEHSDLARHITEIESWSSSINMFGMAKPLVTDEASIAISISTQPRKFFSAQSPDAEIEEGDLINGERSFAILGDPGSGKTTTIKRLARKIILSEPISDLDKAQFPIVILGRNIRKGNGLFKEIFEKIGFALGNNIDEDAKRAGEIPTKLRNDEIKRAVSAALHRAHVVIFIDGIDEAEDSVRIDFDRDVGNLHNILSSGKIISTCRSGDWRGAVADVDVVEMSPLTDHEIRKIVALWADEPAEFMRAIAVIPYRDILDRPLFLTMLLILFNQTGDLPDSPVDVYHRITNLLIEKWDSQRRITRNSIYKGFLSEKKFKFLCSLAFVLTIKFNKRRFSSYVIKDAIKDIGPRYQIPEHEWEFVVQEIESHTGIIVESGFENFEFCHLTVQEFLAASHLVTVPGNQEAVTLLDHSPATVAVAVSLSGNPQAYLDQILSHYLLGLERRDQLNHGDRPQAIKPFVARLRLERPIFVVGDRLATAALMLLYVYDILSKRIAADEINEHFHELNFIFESPAVRDSMFKARKNWQLFRSTGSRLLIEWGVRSDVTLESSGRVELSARAMEFLNSLENMRPVVALIGGSS